MKRALGITCDCITQSGFSALDTLSIIKDTGFDCTFCGYENKDLINKNKNKADKLGLSFEFIHGPFKGVNNLWLIGDDYQPLMQQIKECIDSAQENAISTVVCHVSSSWHPPQPCDLGYSRFDQIVEHAEKRGVKIAFENTRKFGNHASIMHRYENNDNVGFCYDNGHEYCFTETVPFIDIYHKKMLCTHLHDNFGRDHNDLESTGDFHYLPFDGTFDYKTMINKMDKFNYSGSLTLEVFTNRKPEYMLLSPSKFIKLAYEKLKKITDLSE